MYRERIAIVGGVAAGPAAAAQARRVNPEAGIFMYEAGSQISYGACEMPYVLSGLIKDSKDVIVNSVSEFSASRNINVLTRHEVTGLDASARILRIKDLSTGNEWSEKYDKIVLATGARPRRLEVAGENVGGVFVFRTLDDLDAIRHTTDSRVVKHAVVVGGGYIGIEVAEAMVQSGVRVSLVHRGSSVLDSYVAGPLNSVIRDELFRGGITVRTDAVKSVESGTDGWVRSVSTAEGEIIGCDLVVVAIGIVPETRLAVEAGLRTGRTGALRVDQHMRTSASGIWACGDCVEVERVVDGAMIHSPLAPTAYRTARVAGTNAARRGRGKAARFHGVTPASAVKLFDLEVASVGLRKHEAKAAGLDVVSNCITGKSRAHMYPGAEDVSIDLLAVRPGGRVVGAELVGREGIAQRANVVAMAIRQRLTVSELKEVDLIYAPPFAPSIDPLIIAARELEKVLH